MKISAVVITHNEEKNIERCLGNLAWADEIVVVDSFSSDATVEISRKHTECVFQRRFDTFSNQKNFAIQKATHPWILSIDADEEVSPELAREVRAVVARPNAKDAYRLPLTNVCFGRKLRFGARGPDAPVRLFRKENAAFESIVHEVVRGYATLGSLQHKILHHSFTTVAEWATKMNRYTSLEAQQLTDAGRKIGWIRVLLFPPARFVYTYLFLSGWRDGYAGFLMSACGSIYMLVKFLKTRELERAKRESVDQDSASR